MLGQAGTTHALACRPQSGWSSYWRSSTLAFCGSDRSSPLLLSTSRAPGRRACQSPPIAGVAPQQAEYGRRAGATSRRRRGPRIGAHRVSPIRPQIPDRRSRCGAAARGQRTRERSALPTTRYTSWCQRRPSRNARKGRIHSVIAFAFKLPPNGGALRRRTHRQACLAVGFVTACVRKRQSAKRAGRVSEVL
jgi:hypothetical protein